MGTSIIEHRFTLFSGEELDLGMKYAALNDHVSLDRRRLEIIANNAGKTRLNAERKLTPRQAASRALQAYHNEYPRVRFPTPYFDAYVHAIAKMMSWRNPKAKAKREREELLADLKAASYGIDQTPFIDPEINRQLALNLTGHPLD